MSIFSMPQEIHSEILAGLGRTDLTNCATVCQAWARDSQRHLCAYPIIKNAHSAQAFRAFLQNSPESRRHVKQLWLRADGSNRNKATVDPWMNRALVNLAPLLPNLRGLRLQNWGPVVAGSEVIAALRSFKQVTHLDLHAPVFHSSTDLADFVFALPQLSSLRLQSVTWESGMPEGPLDRREYRGRPLPLTKLELCGMRPDYAETFFLWFERHECRPVELVALHIFASNLPNLFRYLSFVGERLEAFTFLPLFSVPAEITFEMCLDREGAALTTNLWDYITDVLRSSWFDTLRRVVFVHEPIKDEPIHHNNTFFLPDGESAFIWRFVELEGPDRPNLRVEARNAPVLDLGVYKEDSE
ncbi:hypothetical protein TRAPUB_8121 [Trametes pubescens]|uniref:F-box domain-containing protein n=1 Tax=Trametes pubescens TaxID=154538 RepID=A0A1M2W635_TRAPU|nr:hypothetical protein TRAPUB_8121 [Trametes pubescens]